MHVKRSSRAGTCEIRTDCPSPRVEPDHTASKRKREENIKHLEFSFFCVHHGKLTKHSYGYGGFQARERFDTAVVCDSCHAPRLSDYKWRARVDMTEADSAVRVVRDDSPRRQLRLRRSAHVRHVRHQEQKGKNAGARAECRHVQGES